MLQGKSHVFSNYVIVFVECHVLLNGRIRLKINTNNNNNDNDNDNNSNKQKQNKKAILNHMGARMVKDRWKRLTRITNDELEKLRLNF